jgi:alpha-glucuronidase
MTSSIIFNKNSPKISFAAKQIEIALKTKKYNPICSPIEDPISEDGLKIVLINQTDEKAMKALNAFSIQEEKELQKEGFSIRVEGSDQNKTLFVLSNDSAGVMYGGFELAEQLTVQSIQNISNETQNPYMAMRGVKQNIPLDFRSPSYD